MDHSKTTLFRTVLFVDEVHRWNKAQQEILLPAIEDGSITLIGATTENPYHSLVGPLLSRCLLLRLEPLEPRRSAACWSSRSIDAERGMGALGVSLTDDALDHLVELSAGDARAALTALEAAVLLADAGETADRRGAGGRRRPEADRRLRPRRQPLRRRLRVHQEHAGLRPGRDAVLARPDDPCRRGPPVHRAADGDLRLRGRRARRPTGAVGRRRGGARARARRHARGSFQPRGGGAVPRAGAQVELGHRRAGQGDGRRRLDRSRPAASARRALRGRGQARARRRLRVPPRLRGSPRGAAVPARAVRRRGLLRADGPGRGSRGRAGHGRARPGRCARRGRGGGNRRRPDRPGRSRQPGATEASPDPWVCWANCPPTRNRSGGNG